MGHVVSGQGIKPQDDKIKAIQNFPVPNNVKAIRSFLGLVGYYRKFINDFASISQPLVKLTKKDEPFLWTEDQENAFHKLQNALITPPILQFPDYNKEFVLECDASISGIGCVLAQKHDNKYLPISFCSRLLKPAEKNYSISELEALAIVWGLKKHKYMVTGYPVRVITDHKPLISIFSKTLPNNGRLCRWILSVQEFDLTFEYREGKFNDVPDCLSRYTVGSPTDEVDLEINTVSVTKRINAIQRNDNLCVWSIDELIQAQKEDSVFGPVYNFLLKDEPIPSSFPYNVSDFKLKANILHHEVRFTSGTRQGQVKVTVVVPESLFNKLLILCHDSVVAGHAGIDRTIQFIQQRYFTHKIRAFVEYYVKTCHQCAVYKKISRPPPPIYNYPIPSRPFQQLHCDLTGPFVTSTEGNRYIINFVDRLTRYVILAPLPDKSAESVARVLHQYVICPYSCPETLTHDNGREFVNSLLEELCKLYKIKQAPIAIYSSYSNGLSEYTNKRILAVLRLVINTAQNDWCSYLPFVSVSLNCAYQHSVGDTAHYLLFHFDKILPYELMLVEANKTQYGGLDDYIVDNLLKAKTAVEATSRIMLDAQSKYTLRHNKRAKIPDVREGDRVYIAAVPVKGKSKKLCPKYKGPFRVLKDLGRERYLLLDLKNGKEIQMQYRNLKVVHEQCVDRSQNSAVRTPFPANNFTEIEDLKDESCFNTNNVDDLDKVYNRILVETTFTNANVPTGLGVESRRDATLELSDVSSQIDVTRGDVTSTTQVGPRPDKSTVTGHNYNTRSRGEVPDTTNVYEKRRRRK